MNRAAFAVLALLLLTGAAMAADDVTSGVWTATAGTDSMQFNFWTKNHGQNGLSIPSPAFTGLSETQVAAVTITPVSFQLNRKSRIHGATPKFIAEMRKLGYDGPSLEDFVRFRIHGVSSEYIHGLRERGYATVSAEDLVRMRIHGVTLDYIDELKKAGYDNVPADKLIEMRIHGIDGSFAQSMNGRKK